MPKRKGAAQWLSSSVDGLFVMSYFIDGVVAASGVSVMVLQGKDVQIPTAAHLFVFQLCYVVPQLLTVPLVERLPATVSARKVLLPLTTLASLASAAIALWSLSTHSMALFFLSRAVAGLFRHPKILFPTARAEAGALPANIAFPEINALALPAMHTGFVVSGLLGDVWKDAVVVQRYFVQAEVLVFLLTCVLAATARSTTRKPVKQQRTVPSAAARSWQALGAMLTSLPTRGTLSALGLLLTFVALRVAAGVNQCTYAIVGPAGYGVPYTVTGLYLVLQDHIIPRVAAPLVAKPPAYCGPVCALLLLVGVWAAPLVTHKGPFVYFGLSLVLVDIPTAVLHLLIAGAVGSLEGCSRVIKEGLSGGLLLYILIAGKLMSAPIRFALLAALPEWKYPSHAVALPAAAHVAATIMSGKPQLGLAAACACAGVLFMGGLPMSASGSADL